MRKYPARVSNTAGAFLCNATLYGILDALEDGDGRAPCGFMHLPYTPSQAAALIAETARRAQHRQAPPGTTSPR